jgi:phage tail sheath protein FI
MTATMPRPGTIINVRTTPPPRSVPTDVGTWFVAGFADRGPWAPQLIQSLSDFVRLYGGRQTYSPLYDALELFFREGGSRAYVTRVFGPAVVLSSLTGWAFKNLPDAGAATSLVARAKGPGVYGNSITVQVQNPGAGGTAGSFSLLVTDPAFPQPNGTTASFSEQSPDFTTQAAAIAWSQQSALIDLVLGASTNLPQNAAAGALATGADDRLNATDATWLAALNRFTRDLGPGQVTQVGRVTNQAYLDTLSHAANNNRVAILDGADTSTVATLNAAVATLRGNANARYGAMFAPWVVTNGLLPGTTRIVPPSAFAAGKIAFNDSAGQSPNNPAAGMRDGQSLGAVIGLSQPAFDNGSGVDVTRDAMYTAGVNQIVYRYGAFENFGWRSLVDSSGADQTWTNFGNVRTAMWAIAQSLKIAENYILDNIDGRGRVFAAFKGDLIGMLMQLYNPPWDALFGAKPEDAFAVDTGPQVNTPTTIAARELHASIALRMSEDAELVVIEFAKVPVTQSL